MRRGEGAREVANGEFLGRLSCFAPSSPQALVRAMENVEKEAKILSTKRTTLQTRESQVAHSARAYGTDDGSQQFEHQTVAFAVGIADIG